MSSRWTIKVLQATGVVLLVALVARVAWWLLAPLVPGLFLAMVLVALVGMAVRTFRR